mmetsp:Transcript_11480/g.16678  ORF Transcript_11480/g.16678 Transcript_11480/m.16678 type:complete len:103 (-) Transcript_11480:2323-2631(-)
MGERSQQQQEQKQQEQPRNEEEDDIHITSINFASALSFAEEEGGGYWNQEKEEEEKSKKKTKISEEIAVFSAGTVRGELHNFLHDTSRTYHILCQLLIHEIK